MIKQLNSLLKKQLKFLVFSWALSNFMFVRFFPVSGNFSILPIEIYWFAEVKKIITTSFSSRIKHIGGLGR